MILSSTQPMITPMLCLVWNQRNCVRRDGNLLCTIGVATMKPARQCKPTGRIIFLDDPTYLLFGRGAQSTTQGSIFNSWVLFCICRLYYSYVERVTYWVVSIFYLKYFTVKYCTCKKTPHATIYVPKIYVGMTLENKTQGITFNHDVGIAIWVLEKLKWLRQYWYC